LTAQGQPTRYAPRAVVLHAVGGTDGHRSTNYWFHSERNRALVAVMNGDPFLAILAPTGLFLRFARALLQAMLSRTQRSERLLIVRALARACLSFVRHLPTALMDRYERRHAKPIRRGKA
jgi:GT2 family glycosyltransferase